MLRPRRFRQHQAIRDLVQETHLRMETCTPIICSEQLESTPIKSLVGHQRLDAISLIKQCEVAVKKV